MELTQQLSNNNEIVSKILDATNNALETGLKAILPDFIEDDVIDIKNKFFQEGFSEGIKETINKLEDVGKSVVGIFTGNFESIEQVKRVIQNNGILDGISEVIDKILKKLLDGNKISKEIYNLIKNGKKQLISTIEKGFENLYKENSYNMDTLNQYCSEWKKQYNEKDYEGMENTMKKIKQKLSSSKLVEETIKQARNIENIQNYINEKGSLDEISDDERALLEKIN